MISPTRRQALTAGAVGAAAAIVPALTGTAPAAASGRSADNPLFGPDNSMLVLIDYQPEMVTGVTSMHRELLKLNVKALARIARLLDVPTVLTTVGVKAGVNHPTIPYLREEIPDLIEYDRMNMNAWEDGPVRRAVKATGRRNIVFAALWTEICLAFPVVRAQSEGYRTMFVADAVGGTSPVAHESGIQRLIQAGSIPNSFLGILGEWVRDWSDPRSDAGREVVPWYWAELAKLDLG
ncbi:isochorismatase family protein [Streptomyces sp. GMY02]|uniref:isochorismatase family protein n=1 Tax=Streptomyces sp. GMY02 TaxID=1333528 RepID=UPI001C2C107B|nr:isochorismatase family protein [Streptomyces sp. GMY02]QXE34554.1 isochorismatase family protein [Streptomyces sp. GMY02]